MRRTTWIAIAVVGAFGLVAGMSFVAYRSAAPPRMVPQTAEALYDDAALSVERVEELAAAKSSRSRYIARVRIVNRAARVDLRVDPEMIEVRDSRGEPLARSPEQDAASNKTQRPSTLRPGEAATLEASFEGPAGLTAVQVSLEFGARAGEMFDYLFRGLPRIAATVERSKDVPASGPAP